jgi:hypothetical protein
VAAERRHPLNSQPSPTPLSPQRSASALWTHDGGSARAGQALGQHVSIKMVNSAWAGDVRCMCSRAGWTGTPPHPPPPVRRLLRVEPLLQTRSVRTRHSTKYTASTPRRRDTLECTCCSEGGSWPSCAKALLVAASGWEADCAVDAFYTRIATVPQRQPSRCRGFTRWFTATKRWWTSSARWRAPFASRRCVRSRIRSSVRPQLPHARR